MPPCPEEESRSAGGAGGNDLIKYLIRKQFQFAFGIYSRAPRRIHCDDDVRSRDGSRADAGKECVRRKTRRVRVRPSIIMPKDSAACNL
jgi:hypothetical protein